jgi:hypothetical protein
MLLRSESAFDQNTLPYEGTLVQKESARIHLVNVELAVSPLTSLVNFADQLKKRRILPYHAQQSGKSTMFTLKCTRCVALHT